MRVHVLALILVVAACTPAHPPVPRYAPAPESEAPLDSNPHDVAVLNRLSWGATTASAQQLRSEGLARWLNDQLHPTKDDGLPEQARIAIDGMDISRQSLADINADVRSLRQAANAAKGSSDADPARKAYQQKLTEYARQAATRSLLRDLYSKNQLKEQLTWFWMNHFNVNEKKAEIRAFVGDYEEHAIRPNVMGKFRDLLIATAFHPAMLQYLDNAQNAAGKINENYAREIMELHTMGVGSGYTQKDVQELARILTGVGVNLSGRTPGMRRGQRGEYREGNLFQFNPNRHDYGDKVFLGHTIRGEGLNEVAEAIVIITQQPATAHFISNKLAQFFCCDAPPESLVSAMANTFRSTDGDITAVLETLFASPEFAASLNGKFKDPIHFAVSALRVTYGDTVILNAQPLMNWLNRMGEPLYGHETPDGYPLTEASWSGPGEMETRFEIARLIGSGRSRLYLIAGDPGPEPAPTPDIRQSHYFQAIAPTLGAATRSALAQAKSPAEWNMLFLSSPEFMHR